MRVRPGASFAALALLFVAMLVVRRHEPLGVDQGLFACFAHWIPRGWLPYRDIFDSKPPLFLYSYALARLFPVGTVGQIWCLEAAGLIATMWVAYATAKRAWGADAGLWAAALILIAEWTPGWGGWWARAQADELAALPMLAALYYADRQFWSGFLVGVAGLFKIPAMAMAPAVLRKPRFVVGLLTPWLMAAAWFAAHGAFGDFVKGVFEYHRYNAAFIAPPWSQVIVRFSRELIVNASLLLVLAAIGIARDSKRLLPFVILTLLVVMLERQLAGYQFLLAMPALAVAGARGAIALSRRKMWILAPLFALTTFQWWSFYSHEDYGANPPMEASAAEYLRAHTQASDGILVWGLAPSIYALSDRHPVTRYPFHKILYTEAPLSRMIPGLEERRAELLAQMDRDPPRYVLVGRRDQNGFEPEDSFTSLKHFPALDERLHNQYEFETEIGRFIVLRRR